MADDIGHSFVNSTSDRPTLRFGKAHFFRQPFHRATHRTEQFRLLCNSSFNSKSWRFNVSNCLPAYVRKLKSGLSPWLYLKTEVLACAESRTRKRSPKGDTNVKPMRRYVSWGMPMSASTTWPVLPDASPVLGRAKVIVQTVSMNSPGVSPVVESIPEGTSSERIGAPVLLAQAIRSAKMPRGADCRL